MHADSAFDVCYGLHLYHSCVFGDDELLPIMQMCSSAEDDGTSVFVNNKKTKKPLTKIN